MRAQRRQSGVRCRATGSCWARSLNYHSRFVLRASLPKLGQLSSSGVQTKLHDCWASGRDDTSPAYRAKNESGRPSLKPGQCRAGRRGAGRLAPRRVGTPAGWNKPTHRERQPKPKKSRGANGCFPFQHSHGQITPWTLPPGALLLFLRRAQRPRSAARAGGARMNTPNVHAGRLERRVRLVGGETMPGVHGFCSFCSSGTIRGVPLLRLSCSL